MAQVRFGGDPENYMDPPQGSVGSLTDQMGMSPIAALFDILGINRSVTRGPKKSGGGKLTSKSMANAKSQVAQAANAADDAGAWLDSIGAAAASDDLANRSGPLKPVLLPPSLARQSGL